MCSHFDILYLSYIELRFIVDEEFEVQGFGDYDYGDYEDYENDYEDLDDEDQFGDFEEDLQDLDENDKANRDDRKLKSAEIISSSATKPVEDKSNRDGKKMKSQIPSTIQKLKENSKTKTKPIISYKYRLINPN